MSVGSTMPVNSIVPLNRDSSLLSFTFLTSTLRHSGCLASLIVIQQHVLLIKYVFVPFVGHKHEVQFFSPHKYSVFVGYKGILSVFSVSVAIVNVCDVEKTLTLLESIYSHVSDTYSIFCSIRESFKPPNVISPPYLQVVIVSLGS